MPPLHSCLPVAAGATAVGGVVLAAWRTLRHRNRAEAFGLSDALGAGAAGGVVALAAGAALCVLRDGTTDPWGGAIGAWVGLFLPLAGPGLIAGAALGAVTAFTLTWGLTWLRGPNDGGPAAS
jgi:hypothetical protein